MVIDILTHNDEARHFGLEGELVEMAKDFLVMVACALQYLHKSGATNPNTDPSTIEDLADNFLFSKIQKIRCRPDFARYSAKTSVTRTHYSAMGV